MSAIVSRRNLLQNVGIYIDTMNFSGSSTLEELMKRSGYVDFAALKQRVSIVQVIEMLNLTSSLKAEGDRLLGCCPIHKGSNEREFVVTPSKGLWFCRGACNAGGDMIELVARVRGIRVFHAAREIAQYFRFEGEQEQKESLGELIAFPAGELRPRVDAVRTLSIQPEIAQVSAADAKGKSGGVLKVIVSTCGVLAALGFLAMSALTNYLFASTLGRNQFEAYVYGAVGVLAVLFNALSPFFLAWGRAAGRPAAAIAAACLWLLCLSYSLTSALGFAAENRGSVAAARQAVSEAEQSAKQRLADLEATRAKYQRPPKELDDRIDRVRAEVTALRRQTSETSGGERQTEVLARLTFGLLDSTGVRSGLVALFAVMVEAGAALGLFAALAHFPGGSKRDGGVERSAG
jgi:CHC2 zinc finger